MESIVETSRGKIQRSEDVLVSFDGSSSQFISKYIKSRNIKAVDENSQDLHQKLNFHHPKVNLPFFRNNRGKKLKVFNIKSAITRNDEKPKVLRITDESVHLESTQEIENNKINNFTANKRDFRNRQNELSSETPIMHILKARSPSISVQKERLEMNTNQEALEHIKMDLFNVKPQIFNGGGNYKKVWDYWK